MTYDIYAMFKEGAYKIVESNNSEHGMDVAEQVCKTLGQWPSAFISLVRGEHVLDCAIFSLDDFKKRIS